MAEEAAVFENGPVRSHNDCDRLTGIARGIFEGEIVCLEARTIDLDGFGEERATRLLCVEAVRDNNVRRRLALTDQRDVGMVLGYIYSFVIDARFNFNEHPAKLSIWAGFWEGVMIQGHLNCGEFGRAFDSGFDIRRDSNMDILRVSDDSQEQGDQQHMATPGN